MEYTNILTTCIYCGCGCGINFEVMDGEIVDVLPARDHPVGQGSLCIKGWNAHGFIYHEDRLQTPLVREDGELREATWDQALDLVAEKLGAIKTEHGPDALGLVGVQPVEAQPPQRRRRALRQPGRVRRGVLRFGGGGLVDVDDLVPVGRRGSDLVQKGVNVHGTTVIVPGDGGS